MDEAHRQAGEEPGEDAASDVSGDIDTAEAKNPSLDESLMEEASALIDDARTYAEAELAFQKTRAKLAGGYIGVSAGLVVVAIILLHIAFLALAVGLVIALEPLVTIWGAIAIVFGGLLGVVVLLGWMAMNRAQKLAALFSSADSGEEE